LVRLRMTFISERYGICYSWSVLIFVIDNLHFVLELLLASMSYIK